MRRHGATVFIEGAVFIEVDHACDHSYTKAADMILTAR